MSYSSKANTAKKRKRDSERLLELVADSEFAKTGSKQALLTTSEIPSKTFEVRSTAFRSYLSLQFWRSHGRAVRRGTLDDVIAVLEGRALFEGQDKEIFVRVTRIDDVIWLDLCSGSGEVVRVADGTFEITSCPEMSFRRVPGMLAINRPESGSDAETKLRRALKLKSEEAFMLIVGWLLMALSGRGPYPILILVSEHGSGKTTLMKILRLLIDPNEAPIRGIPKNEHDLAIAASNGLIIALDNLSTMPAWLGDALCRLSTGGSFSTRRLYSDSDEILLRCHRPVVMSGSAEIATRADILDRAIVIDLPPITNEGRKEEAEILRSVERDRPVILAWLLETLAGALWLGNCKRLAGLPRMADFVALMAAAEEVLGWETGSFQATFEANASESHEIALDQSSIARTLLSIIPFEGTMTELLYAATAMLPEELRRSRDWPQSVSSFGNALRRIIPSLRKTGIQVCFARKAGGNRDRIVTVYKAD